MFQVETEPALMRRTLSTFERGYASIAKLFCKWTKFSCSRRSSQSSNSCCDVVNFDQLDNRKSSTRSVLSTPVELDVKQRYRFIRRKSIGKGTFGKVKLAICRATKKKVAIKIIPKSVCSQSSIINESTAMRFLNHPNIIKLHQICSFDDKWYLIMERASGTNMLQFLSDYHTSLCDKKSLYLQLVSAVAYLHAAGILHCDIKPMNIMISAGGGRGVFLKLIDFGSAVNRSPHLRHRCTTHDRAAFGSVATLNSAAQCTESGSCGEDSCLSYCSENEAEKAITPIYCPPEVLCGAADAVAESFDVWSCGVVLYMLFEERHPFNAKRLSDSEAIIQNILHDEVRFSNIWDEVGLSPRDAIAGSLQKNASSRPHVAEMLDVEWNI